MKLSKSVADILVIPNTPGRPADILVILDTPGRQADILVISDTPGRQVLILFPLKRCEPQES